MVWLETDSEEIAALVALLPVKLAGLPKGEPSMENCTVPVGGTTEVEEVTVAVNVTL